MGRRSECWALGKRPPRTLDNEEENPEHSDGSSHNPTQAIPMLLSVVVASDGEHAGEARRAASRLERVGRQFQSALAEEQKREREDAAD